MSIWKQFVGPSLILGLSLGVLPALNPEGHTAIAQTPSTSASEPEEEAPQARSRIAVLDFDFSSISSNVIFGRTIATLIPGSARATSDLLIDKLVKTGNYVVVERTRLDEILLEQNLGASGRVDASTAAEIGRLLGVEAVIIGSVTEFDVQEKRSGFSAFGVGVRKRKVTANVQVNIRMVNTSTGEILTTSQGEGEADESSTGVSARVFGEDIATGELEENVQQLFSAATEQAVEQVADDLSEIADEVAALPPVLPTIDAIIADVYGSDVILNRGTSDNYRVGMRLSVEQVVREVKDPETGEILRKLTEPIGEVEVIEVDAASSVGRIVFGGGFAIGNVAKPVNAE